MRLLLLGLLVAVVAAGCAGRRAAAPAEATPRSTTSRAAPGEKSARNLVVTPDNFAVGKVSKVNSGSRFVVLSFPVGRMPQMDQQLAIYRRGLKVGELRITGPQLDENVVADLVNGEAEPGDEVRER